MRWNLLLTLISCGIGLQVVFAQANVRLNLVLNRVQNLQVSPNRMSLSLTYSKVEDYRRGEENLNRSHISVFSTEAFEVKVRLANNPFIRLGKHPVNKLNLPTIVVKASSAIPLENLTFPVARLHTVANTLISSNSATVASEFDVIYEGSEEQGFAEFLGQQPADTQNNDILFSIETR